MRRKIVSAVCVLSLIVALLLALTSCGGTTTTTSQSPTSSAPTGDTTSSTAVSSTETTAAPSGEQKVLKIGSIVALSTPQGLEIQKWMDLFAKGINEQGGWKIGNDTYTVEYTAYDSGFADATKTRSATEKAVLQDGVKVLVCNMFNVEQVTGTVAEPNQVLTMGLDASTGAGMLTDGVNKYFFDAAGIFFGAGFYVNQFDYYKQLGATDYLVVGQDAQQARGIISGAVAAAAGAGLKPLEPLYYTGGTVDFGPLATKIISQNPTFVDLGPTSGDALVGLLTALHDAGYKGLIAPGFMDEGTLDKLVAKFGAEWFEGMKCKASDPRSVSEDPKMVALFDAYVEEYGEFKSDGCRWVSPWFFFVDAVNATQSVDSTVLVDYLSKSKTAVMTLQGYALLVARPDLKNLNTVQAVIPNLLGVIHDGKLVVEKAINIKDEYLATIKAYGMVPVYEQYWNEAGKPDFPAGTGLMDYSDLAN
jgi:ABC-type branched-subunit amino acid transport system substrate-binding protein